MGRIPSAIQASLCKEMGEAWNIFKQQNSKDFPTFPDVEAQVSSGVPRVEKGVRSAPGATWGEPLTGL